MSLIEDLQARVAELEAAQRQTGQVAEINFRLSSATTEPEILEAVAALAAHYQVTSSALAYAETDIMGTVVAVNVVASQVGNDPALLVEPSAATRFSLAQLPLLELALQTPNEPLFVENLATDPRTAAGDTRAVAQALGIAAAIVMWFQPGG
ncbi:MAG TPA: hypothetical protein VHO69_08190, partial [Phototrophicaceae bacterium]|nr:hypothetical protein [Phototrophicaceae bacterium]